MEVEGRRLTILDAAHAPPGAIVASRLHLHPAVTLYTGAAPNPYSLVASTPTGKVRISAQYPLRLEPGRASRQFGVIERTTILVQELRPRSQSSGGERVGWFTIEPLP